MAKRSVASRITLCYISTNIKFHFAQFMHECTFFWAKFITFLGINIIANGILFNYNLCKNTKCEKEEEKRVRERERYRKRDYFCSLYYCVIMFIFMFMYLFFLQKIFGTIQLVCMNERKNYQASGWYPLFQRHHYQRSSDMCIVTNICSRDKQQQQ